MKISTVFTSIAFIFALAFITNPVEASTKTSTTSKETPTQVEAKVREYFKNSPEMIEIARCESKFRQYTDGGTVLRSAGMIGVFQFFESIHTTGALALGFDLTTLDGNLGYAKHVYETQGTIPWNGSAACWDTTPTSTISNKPNREQLMQQIVILTKLITLLQTQLSLKQAGKNSH